MTLYRYMDVRPQHSKDYEHYSKGYGIGICSKTNKMITSIRKTERDITIV